MATFQLYPAVVIYNKACEDSFTCQKLAAISSKHHLLVLVADNSTMANDNNLFCLAKGWKYLPMGGNRGLSFAYNRILEEISSFSKNDVVIWLDDDTEIQEDYFVELESELEKQPKTSVFVPIVYGSDGVIYSPNERGFLKNKLISSPDQTINPLRFNAINSCMAVRTIAYQKYRYDERLFMDSVDQKFCEDMTRKNLSFSKLNIRIRQNFFQRSESLSSEKAWARYQIRIKDFMLYANRNCFYRWLGVIKVLAWGLQIGIKCKSVLLGLKCFFRGITLAIELSMRETIQS